MWISNGVILQWQLIENPFYKRSQRMTANDLFVHCCLMERRLTKCNCPVRATYFAIMSVVKAFLPLSIWNALRACNFCRDEIWRVLSFAIFRWRWIRWFILHCFQVESDQPPHFLFVEFAWLQWGDVTIFIFRMICVAFYTIPILAIMCLNFFFKNDLSSNFRPFPFFEDP